jgi:signal transduction histidine kinase
MPTAYSCKAGLGLNLVTKAIEASGGSVALESQPGTGTAFILTLPGEH